MSVIPIIDPSSPDAPVQVRAACARTGFFYLVNHGVPDTLVADQFERTRRFFALPLAERMALASANSPAGNGYDPLRSQVLRSGTAPDLKESFHIGPELPDDHPHVARGLVRYGHNQWPAALPEFRAGCLAYFAALEALGLRVMGLIARSLNLPEDHFRPFHTCPMSDLRMLHYPAGVADPADGRQFGAGAHQDWGGVTLLAQDDVGGLEVEVDDGVFLPAPPLPGSFVVNIGQLIARWSNGHYRSNVHRVLANGSGRSRYSIPFFFNPDFDAEIVCLPGCSGPGDPPRFAPCTAGAHIDEMRRAAFARAAGAA